MKFGLAIIFLVLAVVFLSILFSNFVPGSDNLNAASSSDNLVYLKQTKVVRDVPKSVPDPEIKKTAAPYILEEAGSTLESPDSFWWLNSGGEAIWLGEVFETLQGDLPETSKWREEYSVTNPEDTDNGYHPQNLFRLVTKKQWGNFEQEAYFRINKYWLSSSQNRNESNGILLFSRYLDSGNLYYAGLRVDGAVVIKKKLRGEYYVLAEAPYYRGRYDRANSPNLLPLEKWIGLKVKVTNQARGGVLITLYMDEAGKGSWQEVLSAVDSSDSLQSAAHAGIRTDFMDVEIRDYNITENQ